MERRRINGCLEGGGSQLLQKGIVPEATRSYLPQRHNETTELQSRCCMLGLPVPRVWSAVVVDRRPCIPGIP